MSIPALRQPKIGQQTKTKKPVSERQEQSEKPNFRDKDPEDYLIVTLKGGKKLVVSSDAYHGILTAGELYRCVFCETEMILDVLCKERHKTSQNHRKIIENHPHVEEFKENLIRKLSGGTHYCTVCNVVVQSNMVHKHISSDNHISELQKASIRADTYKPTSENNEQFPPLPPVMK